MSPAIPLAKSNPYSNLRANFDSSLKEFEEFIKFMSSIKPPDIRLFWGRRESSDETAK
ncbi:hypothetical protein PHISCL_01441 [Aspergillus sclerotialis]|uniref:Uncharacterized protein n=1 Tax=Aspergillus sclerotialis TaxID=2070753 RepID=A0A3A2ZV35_9EURO|nr:hypothetical protein PHISCL_01441 [Aspergillus sclerotialis]